MYMEQPINFEVKENKHLILPFETLHICSHFVVQVLRLTLSSHHLYFKTNNEWFVILSLYVDDLLLIENNLKMLKETKSGCSPIFLTNDTSEASYVL